MVQQMIESEVPPSRPKRLAVSVMGSLLGEMVIRRLQELQGLHKSELISDEVYQEKRQEIVGDMTPASMPMREGLETLKWLHGNGFIGKDEFAEQQMGFLESL